MEKFLNRSGLTSPVEISLAFVGNKKMKQLNRQYRNLDQSTTVLTFSQLEVSSRERLYPDSRFHFSPDEVLRLGDLVICYPQAQILANTEGILVDEEVNFLIKHGLRNLLKGISG
ncbi:MAG: rRNA maturation RNase YbeY [Candidatus Pacebacteria bacterium]|nr:rRNA maturation RNase YbeY [Candidatus Paceibacterota bacterium]